MRVILLAIGLLCVGCSKGGLSRGVPDDWTHRDLGEWLGKNDLPSTMIVESRGNAFRGASAFYVRDSSAIKTPEEANKAIVDGNRDVILADIHKSHQEAKDAAATSKRGFASGRWCFYAHPETAAKLQKLLGSR